MSESALPTAAWFAERVMGCTVWDYVQHREAPGPFPMVAQYDPDAPWVTIWWDVEDSDNVTHFWNPLEHLADAIQMLEHVGGWGLRRYTTHYLVEVHGFEERTKIWELVPTAICRAVEAWALAQESP